MIHADHFIYKYDKVDLFLTKHQAVLDGDNHPDPKCYYSKYQENGTLYIYSFNTKKYYDVKLDMYFTRKEFAVHIDRIENLISFW